MLEPSTALSTATKTQKAIYTLAGVLGFSVLHSQIDSEIEFSWDVTEEIRKLIQSCPSLMSRVYRPTPFLPFGILQTLYFLKKNGSFDENVILEKEIIPSKKEDGVYYFCNFLKFHFRLGNISKTY